MYTEQFLKDPSFKGLVVSSGWRLSEQAMRQFIRLHETAIDKVILSRRIVIMNSGAEVRFFSIFYKRDVWRLAGMEFRKIIEVPEGMIEPELLQEVMVRERWIVPASSVDAAHERESNADK